MIHRLARPLPGRRLVRDLLGGTAPHYPRVMSRRSETVVAETCVALGATDARVESYPSRELSLGSLAISRALPVKDRRLVGPWCFLDRFGPLTFNEGKPMDVAPNPHIGLQTVTWLLQGEVVHDDSLGYESVLRPGGVNVMTSGGGTPCY
jgi:hypothetical protein